MALLPAYVLGWPIAATCSCWASFGIACGIQPLWAAVLVFWALSLPPTLWLATRFPAHLAIPMQLPAVIGTHLLALQSF